MAIEYSTERESWIKNPRGSETEPEADSSTINESLRIRWSITTCIRGQQVNMVGKVKNQVKTKESIVFDPNPGEPAMIR